MAIAALPLVSLRDVGKTFSSGVAALANCTIEVRAGEFVSLLGPSGCGKSTVLRLLAGLTSPTSGSLTWYGPRPAIGYVFQEPTLMPWSTVFANVWLPLRVAGVSRRNAEGGVMEALETVGLSGLAGAYPRELSSGMKMRVSIARALVTRPAVLLMDEPFAALDEITRNKLNDDLAALRSRLGASVVFVTHSVYESVYLSERILVMAGKPGRVSAEISVPAPLPRDESFRLSAPFAELCRQTSAALRLAMDQTIQGGLT